MQENIEGIEQETEVIKVVLEDENAVNPEKKRADELLDSLMRTKADFDNYRKRMINVGKSAREEGNKEVILKLLPAIDAFTKARDVIKDASVLAGLELIYSLIMDVFTQFNVERIKAVGEEFNPDVHEAVYMCDDAANSGKVTEVVQHGYTFNGLLLRAAKVIVAK